MSHRVKVRKTGRERNDLCPCGSGKKYKKCCGAIKPKKPEVENQTQVIEPGRAEMAQKIEMPTQKALDWMFRTMLRGY